MPFSSEIKNFRLSCLMNQTEFGDALGVSFTTVNRWENGKARPNIKAMKALKQYCEENDLLYEPLEKSWREVIIREDFETVEEADKEKESGTVNTGPHWGQAPEIFR